jgi:hypothetical protein
MIVIAGTFKNQLKVMFYCGHATWFEVHISAVFQDLGPNSPLL